MKVWIDADECMGAGTCEQIVPEVFYEQGDGWWAVGEGAAHFGQNIIFDGQTGNGHGPDGSAGTARVPGELSDLVIEAADECPAECIYLEA